MATQETGGVRCVGIGLRRRKTQSYGITNYILIYCPPRLRKIIISNFLSITDSEPWPSPITYLYLVLVYSVYISKYSSFIPSPDPLSVLVSLAMFWSPVFSFCSSYIVVDMILLCPNPFFLLLDVKASFIIICSLIQADFNTKTHSLVNEIFVN